MAETTDQLYTPVQEFEFWSRQMQEHCLFLHLGTVDDQLKKVGISLENEWKKMRAGSQLQYPKVLDLIARTRNYKLLYLQKMKQGWVGYTWNSFVEHIMQELDYFNDKFQGRNKTYDEEITFWSQINGDHAAFAASLVDPVDEVPTVTASLSYRDKFRQIEDQLKQSLDEEQMSEARFFSLISEKLDQSEDLGQQFNQTVAGLDQKIRQGSLLSIINPLLSAHVLREGQRSVDTMQRLKQMGSF